MKKILPVFALALVLFALPFRGAAVQRLTLKVVGTESVKEGEVRAEVFLENNPGIAMLQFKLEYDREKIELLEVEDGGILGTEIHHNLKEGILSWENFTYEGDFFEDGRLCTLLFRVTGGEVGEEVKISPVKTTSFNSALNLALENVPLELEAGSVILTEPDTSMPLWPFFAGGGVLVLAGAAVFLKRKKK